MTAQGMRYIHVDVFSRYPYRGNGLTVFPQADGLSGEQMLAITREMRQFESIFLLAGASPGGTAARIFTEDEELDFAGHPVLGAAAVLHGEGAGETATVAIELNHGPVTVSTRRCGGWWEATMDQGVAEFGPTLAVGEASAIASALGLEPGDLHPDLPVQMVSTGLAYIIVPVRSGLDRSGIVHPQFEELLASVGGKFVYVLDPEAPEGRTWDNAGRVEDIATGSAAGPTAAYLAEHGLAEAGAELVIHQGRFVGRPSQIRAQASREGDAWRVSVIGAVAPVGEGVLQALPD